MRAGRGFSLIELLVSLAIAGLALAALAGVAMQATRAREDMSASVELQQQAQFAIDRILRATRGTTRALVPRQENGGTAHSESVRDVLVLTLDTTLDRDGDGFADADNDRDGRIDEDPSEDLGTDGVAGIIGVDDDGDGAVDEGGMSDDDEDGAANEDPVNGFDDDGDGLIDEDTGGDANGDGKAGVIGVDDDGDVFIDEGAKENDDEDGASDDDWVDTAVYRLDGATLLERLPDVNASSGTAFTERPVANGVTQFRVEYIPPVAASRPAMLDLTLTLEGPDGTPVTLNTRARVGAAP
ncbi:MAG: prepilin-type N-terminal cleavage/methylation domain-containing protein [Gammaproteobacteria bacterium]